MTKTQEIVALQEFIRSLPEDTYLRPWLEGVFLEVERAIRCDFLVEVSPTESARRCAAEIAQAQDKAKAIVASAEREKERILIAASHESQKVRDEAVAQAKRIRDEAALKRTELRNKLYALREILDSLND